MDNKCEHIYGFDEGAFIGDEYDEELPRLVYTNAYTSDIQFNYCPLCGEKL